MQSIITAQITRQSILIILQNINELIIKNWGNIIKGGHGGVSNVDNDLQYKYTDINVNNINNNLLQEEINNNYKVGEWDYILTNNNESETILLCHESDIHFEISNNVFINEIIKILKTLNIKYTIKN
jgi:hypothetical protein